MIKYFIIVLIFFSGCKRAPNNTTNKSTVESSVNPLKTAKAIMEGKQIVNDKADSIHLETLLIKCLKIADLNKDNESFRGQIDSAEIDYDKRACYATYQYGTLFSGERKHLLIKRFIINGFETEMYSDIFLFADNNFKKTVADTSAGIGYYNDTIADVNNDGYKDFIIRSYSNSGCCPRDLWNGYLYNHERNKFNFIEFFNPEFNPARNEVFESDYGHPGAIKIYKYKWAGLIKKKVEEIYPPGADGINQPPKPYSFTKVVYPGEKKQIIKNAPEEYKKLKIYEYFISYQN